MRPNGAGHTIELERGADLAGLPRFSSITEALADLHLTSAASAAHALYVIYTKCTINNGRSNPLFVLQKDKVQDQDCLPPCGQPPSSPAQGQALGSPRRQTPYATLAGYGSTLYFTRQGKATAGSRQAITDLGSIPRPRRSPASRHISQRRPAKLRRGNPWPS